MVRKIKMHVVAQERQMLISHVVDDVFNDVVVPVAVWKVFVDPCMMFSADGERLDWHSPKFTLLLFMLTRV